MGMVKFAEEWRNSFRIAKKKKNEEDLILHMANKRLEYLQGLQDGCKYKRGWSLRLLELKDKALSYIKKDPKITGLGILAGAVARYYFMKS